MSNNEESSDPNKPIARARLRSNSYDKAISIDEPKVNNKPSSEPARKPVEDDIHMIKWIEFNHERLPILLQNKNGPCPLLALANILLLSKKVRLNSNVTVITAENLIAAMAEYILQIDLSKLSDGIRANYEHSIDDVLSLLPKLKTGIDVNLKFNGVNKFEYTQECIIFDLLNIQLYHGWIIDPQNTELNQIINSNALSYNQLVEKMIHQRQSNQENLLHESQIIEHFLDDNRSQLTHYGILKLNETMHDNQLAVLFRNNHFSTIWKNKRQLLLLVSDQGYLDHPSIVFETLTDIDNDSVFTDGYGQIWRKPTPVDSSRDRDLAIAIHNDEQRRYREAQLQQQQQQQQQRYSQGYYYEKSSKKNKDKRRRQSYDDHDDCSGGCIIS